MCPLRTERGGAVAWPPAGAEDFFFTRNWGARSGQSLAEFSLLFGLAQANHRAGKARNFAHALDVLTTANQLADEYENLNPNEAPLNRKLLNAMALFHDAREDEAGSAALFGSFAAQLGYSPQESQEVQYGILATSEPIELDTREEKILAMADLYNLGSEDYAAVQKRSGKYLAEAKEAQGLLFDKDVYRENNLRRILNFRAKNFDLGGFEQPWLARFDTNLWRMVIEFAADTERPVALVAQKLGGKALELLGSRGHEL